VKEWNDVMKLSWLNWVFADNAVFSSKNCNSAPKTSFLFFQENKKERKMNMKWMV